MKRCLLFILLSCLAAAGLVRITLVPHTPAAAQELPHSSDVSQRVSQLAEQIHGDDELTRALRQALQQRPGQIVVQDRAAHLSQLLRERARHEAIPGYLEEHFVRQDEKLVLRDGQEEFRGAFLESCATFNEDVERIGEVLRAAAGRMDGEAEVDRLAARFLKHEAAPLMLYAHEMRHRLRPDETLIERRLGELFVADENYQYMIRASRRDEAAAHLRRARKMLASLRHLRAELQEWSAEFAEIDDLNKQAKRLLGDPLFAAFIAADVFGEEGEDLDRRLDGFFNELNHIAIDTADGLAIIEAEPRREIQHMFDEFERRRRVAENLRAPLQAFAAKIRPGDELEEGWRRLLDSDVTLIRLADEFEIAGADAGQAARHLLGELLEEDDRGRLHVRGEEPQEVAEFMRHMFREYRNLRRRTRVIGDVAQQLADPELAQAYASPGGRFLVLHSLQQSLSGAAYDGLAVWIDEHFETTDEGLVLRDTAREEVAELLRQARAIEEELSKDDF